MPCSPRMTKCRTNCLHRRLVTDYRIARLNYEEEVEAHIWETERQEYMDANPGITFKQWLIGHRNERRTHE